MGHGASTVIEIQCKTGNPFKAPAFHHTGAISSGCLLVSDACQSAAAQETSD